MQPGNLRNSFCRLCFCTIIDTNFEVIEKVLSEALRVVVPIVDVEEKGGHVMCKTCSVKLLDAFSFKTNCLNTEDLILLHITSEEVSEVDLKEVYLTENGNTKLITMPGEPQICRLCFQLVTHGIVSINEVDVDILNKYIPQININIAKDPVICGPCFDSLCTHGTFVRDCFDKQEQYVRNHIKIEVKVEESHQYSDSSSQHLFPLSIDESIPQSDVQMNECKTESENDKKFDTDSMQTMHESTLEPQKYGYNFPVQLNHENVSNTQMYKCQTCSYESKSKYSIKIHQLTHKNRSEVPMYNCHACSFETKYKSALNVHLLTHKDPSEVPIYKCDMCDYQSNQKSNLKGHRMVHVDISERERYKCEFCDHETINKGSLKRHQLVHKDASEIQIYKCDKCSYESKYKRYLKHHQLSHESPSDAQMYKCHVCGYEAKRKRYLKRHQLLHEDTHKYECEICGYKTTTESNLRVHAIKHKDLSETQTYKCDVCGFETKYNRSLTNHMLKHKNPSQIELHKCEVCGFATKYKKCLDKHRLTHKSPSEIEMYKCGACDYETKRKDHLKRHRLKHVKSETG